MMENSINMPIFDEKNMTNARYSFCHSNGHVSAGITDLKKSRGNLIDTNGCVILIVTSGYAVASINFRKYPLRKGFMTLFFYDEVFRMEKISSAFSARFVTLSYELIEEALIDVPFPKFWDILYEYPVYHVMQQEWKLLNGWWEQMHWIENETVADYRDALFRIQFHTLLLAMSGKMSKGMFPPLQGDVNRQWRLVTDFLRLLNKYCTATRDVQFYADELCITTSYLNKLCRKVLQVSPKTLIDRLTVSEIKSCLANTDWSVKKIAEELHFEDVSYLCRYFRRLTGMSPIDYRNYAETL
ncbi:helix-turn-helix domain-containing protein [Phocaeicola dorei]|uniref:helix-turn-helix domain-containing protein n=1 Tax=Phocaeicola dorei TaxID=357276 RepID=UPI00319E3CDF